MKTYHCLAAALLSLAFAGCTTSRTVVYRPAPPPPRTVVATTAPVYVPAPVHAVPPARPHAMFYDDLAPHGQWLQDPVYGHVWSPFVDAGFQPYASHGYWVMTEFGNTWVSDFAWGWAPFHYGRWFFDDFRGWLWVPGNIWGPAWVSWRTGGGYYGWAPLGPGMRVGVAVNIPFNSWCFLPQARIYHRD
ncbi:MAG: DUF6600 domain-containing protein, partial [Catalinimonas sp.]